MWPSIYGFIHITEFEIKYLNIVEQCEVVTI